MLKQVPINTNLGGLYEWTMITPGGTRAGHVVVRAPGAKPIGNFPFPDNSETWYWGASSGDSGDPVFILKVALERAPDDAELVAAVGAVVQSETSAGTVPMVPSWKGDPPLPQANGIVTLTDVIDGPGSYDDLYTNVSFFMPIDGAPVLPTFYTSIPDLYSIFGGSSKGVPIQEGTTAKMKWAPQGEPGYPDPATWVFVGRDPS